MQATRPNDEFIQAFTGVGQALLTVLFAVLGGLFGAFTARKRSAGMAAGSELPRSGV
jgi:hypothetical protein